MTVEIRRASARFTERAPGRATQHSFSFGDRHDPERLRFGPMVCHDDHLLAAGEGFATHRHSGVSIVTWVVGGAVAHTGVGDPVVVAPGQVAVLQTGDGVTHPPVEHSEVAAESGTRFVQVWLATDEPAPPSYDVTTAALEPGVLSEVVSPVPGATFSVARLGTGDTVELPAAGRVHAFVATGALMRSSLAEPLSSGDAFEMVDHPAVPVTAAVPTELLVWAFDD
ncbi:pirin family protein [Nocardioides sp. W7]|uniref:pirin family protein n=1 Tax=Nocardioides sp. W7 TaxID=2931390 RepID=UPI001FD2A0DB|nr:pirin family protein [Nocardioides sp. W7]